MAWKQIKLGDLFEQYRVQHMVEDDRDYGQITISKNGYIKFRTTKNGKSIGRKRQFIIDLEEYPNTLLFTRQGVSEGAIAFAPKEVNGCIATENMPMFSLKDNINRKFVELLLKSEQYISEVKKLIPTGSAQKSIHERDLMQISLTIPIEEEQKELSQKIDNHLNRIQLLNTEISDQQTLLKKLRQSILQEAIEGKLTASWREQSPDVESASILLEKIKAEKEQLIKEKKIKKQKSLPPISEDEIPFDIPDSWEWCRLKNIGKITGGGTPSKHIRRFWNGNIPWISPKDMKSEYINDSELKITHHGVENSSAKLIEKNSLLLVGRSGILKRKLPVAINLVPCTVNQDMKVLIPFKPLQIKYLQIMMMGMQKIILKDLVKFGMTVHSLKYSEFEIYPFPLPPLEEQKEIVKKIENLFNICDELETQINSSKTNSETLIQAVLKEAFEG